MSSSVLFAERTSFNWRRCSRPHAHVSHYHCTEMRVESLECHLTISPRLRDDALRAREREGFLAFQMCKAPSVVVFAPFRDTAAQSHPITPGLSFPLPFRPSVIFAIEEPRAPCTPAFTSLTIICDFERLFGEGQCRSPDPTHARSRLIYPPTHPRRKSRGRGSTQMDGWREGERGGRCSQVEVEIRQRRDGGEKERVRSERRE